MSTTRHADDGKLHQHAFCSAVEYERGLNALVVSKRCSVLDDDNLFPLIWMLQRRSWEDGGLRGVAAELLSMFPDRVDRIQFKLVSWLPVDWLAEHLERACVNPAHRFDSEDGMYWRGSLVDDLCALRQQTIARAEAQFHRTEVTSLVFDALDHALASPGSMTLCFGVPGVGKSEMSRRWCDLHPGVARYIEVPAVQNERSFYSAIAEELGVARGTSYNGQQISLRVIDVLKESRLMLVLDESQRLWPQRNRPQGTPTRILWLTTLVNAGVPIGLLAMPEFFTWQRLMVKWTNWSDAQFNRRLSMIRELPVLLAEDDLRGVACRLMPAGSSACHELLVSYAQASKINLSAITETLRTARILSKKAGRQEAALADIQAAIRDVRAPMDCILAADPAQLDATDDFSQPAKRRRRTPAMPSREVGEPSAPASAEAFIPANREVLPRQAHRRAVALSPVAS